MIISKILVVDDEVSNRNAIKRLFEDFDLDFVEAGNGEEALQVLRQHTVDLVLLDIRMPVMDGFGFLERYEDLRLKPRPPVCIMTAFNDSQTRRKAIYLGADDFINKPIDTVELETRVASLLRINSYQRDLNLFNQNLEKLVKERTAELQQTHERLRKTERANARAYREMIERISRLTQFNQNISNIEPQKLGLCAAAIGWMHGLPKEDTENMTLAAQLYNIGMLALPEKLRETPMENLNSDELVVLASHSIMGSDLFSQSDIPLLKQAYNICRHCEEHFDGTGLPHRIKGKDLPVESRVFSVARLIVETLQQYTSDQVNRVRSAMLEHSDSLLDPEIVNSILAKEEALESLIEEIA